jgi:hypothetical protein
MREMQRYSQYEEVNSWENGGEGVLKDWAMTKENWNRAASYVDKLQTGLQGVNHWMDSETYKYSVLCEGNVTTLGRVHSQIV